MSKKVKEIKKETKIKQAVAWYKNTQQLAIVAAILIITYICFYPALSIKKEFTNWDDPGYVTEQTLVKSLSAENIKTLFKPTTEVMLNYHPLTMISLAINYKYSGLKIKSYIYTNIFIHLFNTFLVFIFIYFLSQKRFWAGAIAALWFGVHPMHVESVAWIAERKDVLYCFFFLLSCITYLRYLETKKWTYLIGVFLLFVLSCLSKAMAVPLPLVLLLIDYYRQRKIDAKAILEKVPFLLLALWIGYNATVIQSAGAIADYHIFSTLQRLMFASYGFMMYWVKLFAPVSLSAFYPYPNLDANGGIPLLYNIAPLIVIVMISVPAWILYKIKNKELLRVYIFGMGFFMLMVSLVLQFISIGAAIMADRYSYLPYIGAFFIIGILANNGLENKKTRLLTIIALLAFSAGFVGKCYSRVKVWTNNEVLWTDVIEKYPFKITQTGNVIRVEQKGVETAYKNRGNYYREKGLMDKAFDDYNILVQALSADAGVYSNMGNMYAMRQQYDKSLEMYSKAIELNPNVFDTYMNRGITYSTMGNHQEALNDFTSALKINPNVQQLYINIASEKLNLQRYDECISDCNSILARNPNEPYTYFYRGTCYVNLGKLPEAIADLQKSLSINATNGNAWFNLSYTLNLTGDYKAALNAAQKAKELHYAVDENYLNGLMQKNK